MQERRRRRGRRKLNLWWLAFPLSVVLIIIVVKTSYTSSDNEAKGMQDALQIYNRAIQLNPNDAYSWNQLGTLLMYIGKLDEAIAAYKKVLILGKDHQDLEEQVWAYVNLGNVYQVRGNTNEAINMLEKAVELNLILEKKENLADNYRNLGLMYKARAELNKNIAVPQELLTTTETSDLEDAFDNQHSLPDDLNKAIDMQKKALQIDVLIDDKDRIATDYVNLGTVYNTKNSKTEAKYYYQKAIEVFKELGKIDDAKNMEAWLKKQSWGD